MQWLFRLSAPLAALLASFFTYFMTALGAAMIFLSRRLPRGALTFTTGLAAGIMIAASFFSLLLPAVAYQEPLPPFLTVTLGFLLGGGGIVLADFCMSAKKGKEKSGALFYGAVTLHNIPEGLAVGVAFACAANALNAGGGNAAFFTACLFAFGIGVQNFPEGLCVAYALKNEGHSVGKSFFLSQLSGSVEVLSALVGALLFSAANAFMPWILSFSAGAMIAVTCSELVPEAFSGEKKAASLGVIFGFAFMTFLDLAL